MQNIYRISVFMYNIPMVLKTIKKKKKESNKVSFQIQEYVCFRSLTLNENILWKLIKMAFIFIWAAS